VLSLRSSALNSSCTNKLYLPKKQQLFKILYHLL
jgi:hypothetical protein